MSTAFQSFNRSALGAFIQSTIDPNARGYRSAVGDLFVVHSGTFEGTSGVIHRLVNADSSPTDAIWESVGTGDNNFHTTSPAATANFVKTASGKLFLSWHNTSNTYSVWWFDPAAKSWKNDLPFSTNKIGNHPSSNIPKISIFQGSLVVSASEPSSPGLLNEINVSGTPSFSSKMVILNEETGAFEAFGGDIPIGLSIGNVDNSTSVIIPFQNKIIFSSQWVGFKILTLNASGYVSAVAGDLGKTVQGSITGTEQQWSEVFGWSGSQAYDFSVTIAGQSVNVTGTGTATAMVTAMKGALNTASSSGDDAYSNFWFTSWTSSSASLSGRYWYLNESIATPTITGNISSGWAFDEVFQGGQVRSSTGILRNYNNTAREWMVTVSGNFEFYYDSMTITIVTGTGAGTLADRIQDNRFLYAYDGTTWDIVDEIQSSVFPKLTNTLVGNTNYGKASGRPAGPFLYNSNILLFGSLDQLDNGGDIGSIFIGTSVNSWIVVSTDISNHPTLAGGVGTPRIAVINADFYFVGVAPGGLDGILKFGGSTFTDVSNEPFTGIIALGSRGTDLLAGTNLNTTETTKPPRSEEHTS